MLKVFLFVFSIVYINAENLDDPDAFIESLPEHEQMFVLDNIARRINDEVVPNEKPNKSEVVLPDHILDVHDAFVKNIMKEEFENMLTLRRQGQHKAPSQIESETPTPKVRKRRADESIAELPAQNVTTEGQNTTEGFKTVAVKIFYGSSAPPATASPEEETTVLEVSSVLTTSEDDNVTTTAWPLASASTDTVIPSKETYGTIASANIESLSDAVLTSTASVSEVSKTSEAIPGLPFLPSRRSHNPVAFSLFNRGAETSKSAPEVTQLSVSSHTTPHIVKTSESYLSSSKVPAASYSSTSSLASASSLVSLAQQYQQSKSPPNNQVTSTQQYSQPPITTVKLQQSTPGVLGKAPSEMPSLYTSSVPLSMNQEVPLLPSFTSPQNNYNPQGSQSPNQGTQCLPPFSPIFSQGTPNFPDYSLVPASNLNPSLPLGNNFNPIPVNNLYPEIPPNLCLPSNYLSQTLENYNKGTIKLIPQYEYSPENAYYRPVNALGQLANGLGNTLRLGSDPLPDEENHYSITVYNYDPSNAYFNSSNRYNFDENDVGNALRFNHYSNGPLTIPAKFPFRIQPLNNNKNAWVDEEYDFGGFFGGLSRIDESNKIKEVLNKMGYDNPEIPIVDTYNVGDLDLLRNVQFNFPSFSLMNAPADKTTNSPVEPDLQSQQKSPNEEKRTALDPYLETLQDMIDSNYDGLKNYDWLRSTVNIQSSLEKLIGITTVENVHPYDISLLRYVRSLYTRSIYKISKKKVIAQTEKGNRLARPGKKGRFRFPKSRVYKLNKYLDPIAIMNRFRSNLGLKGRQRAQENFKMFLIDVQACLDDFHNIIKHVALITTYQNQNWFQNIKGLYFRTRRRKNLLELLLHISAARLFDYLEQSARAYGTELQMSYVLKSEEHQNILHRTEDELKFVKKIVSELRIYQ